MVKIRRWLTKMRKEDEMGVPPYLYAMFWFFIGLTLVCMVSGVIDGALTNG